VGDPSAPGVDLGPLISAGARERLDRMIQAAVGAGGVVLAGAAPLPGPGWFYPPTVLLAESPEPEDALAGAFGPVVIIRGVADPPVAVESPITRRLPLASC